MTAPSEWAKHLRPEGKRQYNKAERRAVKGILDEEERAAKGPGLHSDPAKMRMLKEEQGVWSS